MRRGVARVLVATIVGVTPATIHAGDELPQADAAVTSNGAIDNSVAGQTTITSYDDFGKTTWHEGLDQPENNILYFDLPEHDSSHLNVVGGDFAAHLNGQVRSVDPNAEHTILFSSPYGVFVGSEAIIDVGKLVAVGADLTNVDALELPALPLTGPVVVEGTVKATRGALLYGTHVRNLGDILTPAGQLLMLGGEALEVLDADTIAAGLANPVDFRVDTGAGTVWNDGLIDAADATLVGRRVINTGHIRIDDGTLLMAAGDRVHLRRLEDPIVVSLPQSKPGAISRDEDRAYAIAQEGTIDAGLGHVRLSAADALGWGIRQGRGANDATPEIAARTIEIDAGEGGRVELGGRLDARGEDDQAGGDVTVTGETIALIGAEIDVSSDRSDAGSVRIGGDLMGGGDLQRAKAVVMDEDSTIVADGGTDEAAGDGGRVILFSDQLTHITGNLSARGGDLGGDGGFIETSGLTFFHIANTPDARAPAGDGGEWLIDPYTINIVADAGACPGAECDLNKAVEQVLLPSFDDAGFDGVFRTIDPEDLTGVNTVSADLLVRALSVGTDVTLSTEAFNPNDDNLDEYLDGVGDINVNADILIPNGAAATGTRARLVLRAAGDVNVTSDIRVGFDSGSPTDRATGDMVLDLELRANDQRQRDASDDYDPDMLNGAVDISGDIRTGGGDLIASGIRVDQSGAVDTGGGFANYVSGSRDRNDFVTVFERDDDSDVLTPPRPGNPAIPAPTPGISISGTLNTSRNADDPDVGGAVEMTANGVRVRSTDSGDDRLDVFPGELEITADITTGGGDVFLSAGTRGGTDPGNVTIDGATIDTSRGIENDAGDVVRREGGNLTIDANRLYADVDTSGLDIALYDETGAISTSGFEGGGIAITNDAAIRTRGGDISIGSRNTSEIAIQGTLNTTHSTDPTNMTDDAPAAVREDALDNGMLAIVAGGRSDIDRDASDEQFGDGTITLGDPGGTGGATLLSSAVTLQSREITLLDTTDGISIRAAGDSPTAIENSTLGLATPSGATDDFATVGTLRFQADYKMSFQGNTVARADRIEIDVASQPSELDAIDEPADAVRLEFLGTTSTETLLKGDEIAIEIGDGATVPNDLLAIQSGEDRFDEFEADRSPTGLYSGVGFRSNDATDDFRPEMLTLQQDGDLTIVGAASTTAGELFLGSQSGTASTGGAFGDAAIGAEGQTIELESRDGQLTVLDAAGLNDDALTPAFNFSEVTLHGGFLLPDVITDPLAPSVVIDAGAGFDLHALTITSPRDLVVTDGTVDTLALGAGNLSVDELVVQAGRDIGISVDDAAAIGGTLTVDGGLTIQAATSIELHGAASGFGSLTFASPATTALHSNSIALQAGRGSQNDAEVGAGAARIAGARGVAYRTAAGGDFLNGTTAESFSFRQDASIDDDLALPTLDDYAVGSPTGFGSNPTNAITYALRSDFGTIDLAAVGESRIQDTNLSLISANDFEAPAFVWDGPSLELGGTESFVFTEALSDAFTPSSAVSSDTRKVTLRAGLDGSGTLSFEDGATVRAPIVEMIAGDGIGGDRDASIDVRGAMFDLRDVFAGVERTLVFHEDINTDLSRLPENPIADPDVDSQFAGDVLPRILGVRTDAGLIDIRDPDFKSLPLDFDPAAPARLILEAEVIEIAADNGNDLELTQDIDADTMVDALDHFRLRLRGNTIALRATDGGDAGRVLAGQREGPIDPNDPDSASLIIEGFIDDDADDENERLVTTHLSTLSGDGETDPVPWTTALAAGLAPARFTLTQDGDVTPDELPLRAHVGGGFAQSTDDDRLGNPTATTYVLNSNEGDVTINADNVAGSRLEVGSTNRPIGGSLTFEAGAGGYVFDDILAFAAEEIFVDPGADLFATGQDGEIRLEAGVIPVGDDDRIDAGNPLFGLVFRGTDATTLRANTITLRASPGDELFNPDDDDDGDFDEVPDTFLVEIDTAGLLSIDLLDADAPSTFTATQSAAFDTAPLIAKFSAGEWDTIDLASTGSALRVTDLADLAAAARSVRLGLATSQDDTIVEITRSTTTAADDRPDILSVAAGFQGGVTIESNDVVFDGTTGTAQLQLDSPNLRVVSDIGERFGQSDSARGRVNGDPNVLDRASVTYRQASDFSSTRLVRPDRYEQSELNLFENTILQEQRESLEGVTIRLVTTGDAFTFGDDLRDFVRESNLTIESTSTDATENVLTVAITSLLPGVRDYAFGSVPEATSTDFAAVSLNSLEVNEFDRVEFAAFNPVLPEAAPPPNDPRLTIQTAGNQAWNAPTYAMPMDALDIVLQTDLEFSGRDLLFGGDIYSESAPADQFDLFVLTTGEVRFEGNLGGTIDDERLGSLWVLFDEDNGTIDTEGTPFVQFGRRVDGDGDPDDGVQEDPVDTDQTVRVVNEVVFASVPLNEADDPQDPTDGNLLDDFIAAIRAATSVEGDLADALATFAPGREIPAQIATIGKALGDLSFDLSNASNGKFVMSSGERLAVGGKLTISHAAGAAANRLVTLGDVAAIGDETIIGIEILNADEIGLVRRNAGVTRAPDGATNSDGGSVITANSIDFGGVTPTLIGRGKDVLFGVPDPFARSLPSFLDGFTVAANRPDGAAISVADFTFASGGLFDRIAFPVPTGASRSELSGAFGPREEPLLVSTPRYPSPPADRARLIELDVDAQATPAHIMRDRLIGAAVIDDVSGAGGFEQDALRVTDARLNAVDAEAAVELYESLFGEEGQRAGQVRAVLQDALDRYLETTRARRVIGFELRRFVKNRPSTLLEAYGTLDQLDALFRYHRRLGLSPGEYRRIQARWLADIQPDGITIDELAEAIHPSRYVRGSDILDIFGR